MKKIKYFILLFLLMTTFIQSKTYEDGEDKEVKRWRVLGSTPLGMVTNVYDKDKSSYVIKFKGEGTKSAYMLMSREGASWNNEEEHILHWQMNYGEDFVIIVGMETRKGKRYLIYTPGVKNGYMQYGLGANSSDGTWQRYTRNLQKDLERFENNNQIKSVETFVIRGSGRIDNVKMMKKNFSKKEVVKKEKKKVSKKKKVFKKKKISKKKKVSKKNRQKIKTIRKSKIDSTPVITIQGDNPLYLDIGEIFIDPGVHANDKEDGVLPVISSENIDNRKEGRYSVIYMATDSSGNAAVDTRYVEIGEGGGDTEERIHQRERSSRSSIEEKIDQREEDEEIEGQLEERELEISEWEKELELREKEISQREHQIQTSMQVQDAINR